MSDCQSGMGYIDSFQTQGVSKNLKFLWTLYKSLWELASYYLISLTIQVENNIRNMYEQKKNNNKKMYKHKKDPGEFVVAGSCHFHWSA